MSIPTFSHVRVQCLWCLFVLDLISPPLAPRDSRSRSHSSSHHFQFSMSHHSFFFVCFCFIFSKKIKSCFSFSLPPANVFFFGFVVSLHLYIHTHIYIYHLTENTINSEINSSFSFWFCCFSIYKKKAFLYVVQKEDHVLWVC